MRARLAYPSQIGTIEQLFGEHALATVFCAVLVHQLGIPVPEIVYCACPNEASAARVALQLRDRGFHHVRPLAGGIDAWVSAGLAVDTITAT